MVGDTHKVCPVGLAANTTPAQTAAPRFRGVMTTETGSTVSCFTIYFGIAGADAAVRRRILAVVKDFVHLFPDQIWNAIARSVLLASVNVLGSLLTGESKGISS